MTKVTSETVKEVANEPYMEMPNDLMDVLNLLEFVHDLDKTQYELMLKKLPHLKKQMKIVHKNSHKNLKVAKKLSLAQKKYYYKLAKKIIKLLKDDKVDNELKEELVQVLRLITTYMDEADRRDKAFLSAQQKKVLSYSGVALLTLASLYGVKISKR